ncbi:Sulfite exporter TauE/SafE [Marinomonas gallaica]|uniref:Probable membrane transporter protein n=1 Tax=Marinomonas gallaica TaxID=1806667 RepID=A0A1C3JV74_9GAMM|nr:sulfite exporter TauE/SafE family protein [Marinomonas gallaica]SBT19025.1 Sulfite exporter TauE/SafE [Marinomonas gallaica]SBT21980.1 Sulfite exporter TauE/SafE [Marinomonas gallaica]
MDFIWYILAGVGVGLAVGITGVGGGSLMTPLLLMFGFPPHIAIGTDLLYAGIAKCTGVVMHAKRGNVNWRIMGAMAAGSLPASLLTVWALSNFEHPEHYQHLLTSTLGVMLIITAAVIIFRKRLSGLFKPNMTEKDGTAAIFVCGLVLGVFVTLTSVGAGALGTAMMMLLFPAMQARNVVGTDLAHAVPLTLVAGLGHVLLGNVDYNLLAGLLIGSIPAIYIGTKAASFVPNKVLQPILATALASFGVKYLFF